MGTVLAMAIEFAATGSGSLFGRDGDLTLMMDRLMCRPATLMFAGSGVGKTSFLNAKLAPELENRYFVCIHSSWASEQPLGGAWASLAEALLESRRARSPSGLAAWVEDNEVSLLKVYRTPNLFADLIE